MLFPSISVLLKLDPVRLRLITDADPAGRPFDAIVGPRDASSLERSVQLAPAHTPWPVTTSSVVPCASSENSPLGWGTSKQAYLARTPPPREERRAPRLAASARQHVKIRVTRQGVEKERWYNKHT